VPGSASGFGQFKREMVAALHRWSGACIFRGAWGIENKLLRLLRCMSQVLARDGSAGIARLRLLSGEDRKTFARSEPYPCKHMAT
jgi:hypothetical protein